ncbi:MAG: hypothetical protein ACRD2U_11385 [Terriglobales bacterium]
MNYRSLPFALSVILLLAPPLSLFGQSPAAPPAPHRQKVMAPHRPIAPKVAHPKSFAGAATLRSMVGGLWMTDANFKSAIYLRNIVETDPITTS